MDFLKILKRNSHDCAILQLLKFPIYYSKTAGTSSTCIDNMFVNFDGNLVHKVIKETISDHYGLHVKTDINNCIRCGISFEEKYVLIIHCKK